jgi:hypothetical protein
MITWPTFLPLPEASLDVDVKSSAKRTRMESGRVRQQPRFQREMRTISVSWTLTDSQFSFFCSLYQNKLNGGTAWFNMTLPLGDGVKSYVVRFQADSYSQKYNAVMHWTVKAKLETEDQIAPYSEEEVDLLLEAGSLEDFEAAVATLHEYVHELEPELV